MILRDRLASGSFAVTAEISPPRGASTEPITATAVLLRDWVDAVNVTDNQGSNVRLASWAGSLAALQAGLDDAELRKKLSAAGYQAASRNTPEQFGGFIRSDTAKWVELVARTNMKGN